MMMLEEFNKAVESRLLKEGLVKMNFTPLFALAHANNMVYPKVLRDDLNVEGVPEDPLEVMLLAKDFPFNWI